MRKHSAFSFFYEMAQEIHLRAEFVKGATAPEHFPASDMPEIALIGRSNVGKSSLINALVRSSRVARVSNTPGKTQEINFFVTDLGFMLVDLPGYGYARVSKTQREQFSTLIKQYVLERDQLAVTCVLVDARHDPQPLDLAMIEELEFAKRQYAVILTKCDKLKPAALQARIDQVREILSQCTSLVDVISTSSETGLGRHQLLGLMKRIVSLSTKVSP
ncbi:MAG: YihA family ribosome biogenesis GTP-binding protein [Ignavibacteria bacterium]|nr:YihA family ribosome biogenesis GTP-binding protein [Ignavibacteria bacterium]